MLGNWGSNRVRSLSIFHSRNQRLVWEPVQSRHTTRNQDSRGIRPRGVNRIHQARGEPWGSSVAWVLSRSGTWRPYSYGQTKQKKGLEQCWSSEPERLLLKQKGLWPARRGHPGCKTLQMWTARTSQPPHTCLNGHPAGSCPGRGDGSGGSDSDGALQPQGGVC